MRVCSDFDDTVKICEFYSGDLDNYFQAVLPDWSEEI